jgi:Winged helix-turn-helix DNA-binding
LQHRQFTKEISMNSAARKLGWHEALLADDKLPDAAKVIGGWLMHRFDSASLVVAIAGQTIAEDLGWSISKVSRSIKALKKAGWIRVTKARYCNKYAPEFGIVDHIKQKLALNRAARRAKYPINSPKREKHFETKLANLHANQERD